LRLRIPREQAFGHSVLNYTGQNLTLRQLFCVGASKKNMIAEPVHAAVGPQALDHRSSTTGLRAVASFEALKGGVVVLLLLIIFGVHNRAEDIAENLLFHLHIDPDRRLSQVLLDAATRLSDTRLLTIAIAALSYSSVRFIEAWGLWNRRVWAEWFALLSGALYIPWEALKLAEHHTWVNILILTVNVGIVLYMLYVRLQAQRLVRQAG
jgi:uncharacterized membrane protein (DUF2068 family)